MTEQAPEEHLERIAAIANELRAVRCFQLTLKGPWESGLEFHVDVTNAGHCVSVVLLPANMAWKNVLAGILDARARELEREALDHVEACQAYLGGNE